MRPTLVFPPELEIPPTTADRSILLIGRHPHCDVVLKVHSVSRRHCVLVETDDDLFIRDLGSRHGVWVNGEKVEESRLMVGDEIAIGPVIVRVVDPEELDANSGSADSSESLESPDSPTEVQGGVAQVSYPPGSEADFMVTDPMQPPLAFPGRQNMGGGADVPYASDYPGPDPDDDIPSDSKLEEVL
ncbi:FHA domain-containing protein [bacterium]|nr:FHA domain-containing protein [bacterium]